MDTVVLIVSCRCTYCCPETSAWENNLDIIHDIVLGHFAARTSVNLCPGHDVKLHPHQVNLYRIGCV